MQLFRVIKFAHKVFHTGNHSQIFKYSSKWGTFTALFVRKPSIIDRFPTSLWKRKSADYSFESTKFREVCQASF